MVRSHGGVPRNCGLLSEATSEASDVLYWAPDNLNVARQGLTEERLLTGCSKFNKRQILRDLNMQVRMNRLQRENRRGVVVYRPVLGGEVR